MREHGVQQPLLHDRQQVDGQPLDDCALLERVRAPQRGCQALGRLVLRRAHACRTGSTWPGAPSALRASRQRTCVKSANSLPKNSAASMLRCAPDARLYSSSTTADAHGWRSSCGVRPCTSRSSPAHAWAGRRLSARTRGCGMLRGPASAARHRLGARSASDVPPHFLSDRS